MTLPDRTDSLRDRIAAAIKACDEGFQSPPDPFSAIFPSYDDLADAVIAELDLAIPCAATGCRMRQIARRHAKLSSQLTDDDYDEQYDHPDYTPSWVRRSNDE